MTRKPRNSKAASVIRGGFFYFSVVDRTPSYLFQYDYICLTCVVKRFLMFPYVS